MKIGTSRPYLIATYPLQPPEVTEPTSNIDPLGTIRAVHEGTGYPFSLVSETAPVIATTVSQLNFNVGPAKVISSPAEFSGF
jgi:hypothetical protein